jgi:hypothetical protein
MNDATIKSTKGLSPGEALKLQRHMEAQSRAYAQLSQALMDGIVFGDDVQRLHKLIGGSAEDLSLAEMEIALKRMFAMQERIIRHIR